MSVHIGKIIKKLVKEKDMQVSEFADKINYTRRNVYKIFDKPSIDTALLLKINKVLEINLFFKYISDEELINENVERNKIKESLDSWQVFFDEVLKSRDKLLAQKKEELSSKEKNTYKSVKKVASKSRKKTK